MIPTGRLLKKANINFLTENINLNFMKNIFDETLTTGADGMAGSYVDFGYKMGRRSLDITDLNEVLAVCKKYKPKVILHLAAETDVDRCERDPQYAYLVNSIGTYNMAIASKEIGAKFVYISTSAVFDGFKKEPYQETDECNPQSYYGRSKFLGEIIVKNILDNYIIGRVCWMFGGGPEKDQKFVAKIIRQINQPEINVISGKHGSPTYAKDMIEAIKKLILKNDIGIFHLSNEGTPSRAEIVSEIIKITNSNAILKEVEQSFFDKDNYQKRPDNESMVSRVKIMRPWQEAIREYVLNEWKD